MQNDFGEHGVDLSHLTSSKDSIFRIPDLFKIRNEQAYTPYKFSIGPWHADKTKLLRTGQKFKESFFEGLIHRFPDPAAKKRELEEAIKHVQGKAIECYEGGDVFDVSDGKFEKMLLLDGCFIIELLRARAERFSNANYQAIYHDLLLLDNQVPWFVLELLFERTDETNSTLVDVATEFFLAALPPSGHQERRTSNILHLVDFVWRFWAGSRGMQVVRYIGSGNRTYMPSATRLEEAGVKFKKADSRHTLDVKFNKGVLEFPFLSITPWTETVFRNLIIFEQCSICTPCVTWYAVLLDCLVNTSDDVDLMSRVGVLDNSINPEETADFFNSVRRNTLVNGFCYASLCEEVNIYCQRRWPTFFPNYFSKPWAIVSVVFPMIVMFFSIMQVFYK